MGDAWRMCGERGLGERIDWYGNFRPGKNGVKIFIEY